jgi:D-alanine--poly(phosphoribitol) ligase subunit 2
MDEVISILEEVKPEVNFTDEHTLVDGNVLDSFDIVQIVMQFNEHFDVEVGAEDINPENFNSAGSMWTMVQRLQG